MVEDLDNFLPVDHFFNIGVDLAQGDLLSHKVFGTSFHNASYQQKERDGVESYKETQVNAQKQHGG